MTQQQHSFHLVFNDDYLQKTTIDQTHPTCQLSAVNEISCRFGGSLGDEDHLSLNHIITLDPLPSAVGIARLRRLTIAVDFELLFNSLLCDRLLFYQHDGFGYPHLLTTNIIISNEYDKRPLLATRVRLALTPIAWRKQVWGEGNNHKIGGMPIWVQTPEDMICPRCKEPMKFLMHLNSDLPVAEPRILPDGRVYKDTIMFGSGGIYYIFWCDQDHVSGHFWQCT